MCITTGPGSGSGSSGLISATVSGRLARQTRALEIHHLSGALPPASRVKINASENSRPRVGVGVGGGGGPSSVSRLRRVGVAGAGGGGGRTAGHRRPDL